MINTHEPMKISDNDPPESVITRAPKNDPMA